MSSGSVAIGSSGSISSLVRRIGAKASLPALIVTLLLLATPAALASRKQVRLLIPILTGHELDQVRKLAPAASITTINGETFLEVGSFTDARVAHRLGRSIQKRLSIPFDLAYDPDHPQIALALDQKQVDLQTAQVRRQVQPALVASAPQNNSQPKPDRSDPFWEPLAVNLQVAALHPTVVVAAAPLEQPLKQTAAIAEAASVKPLKAPLTPSDIAVIAEPALTFSQLEQLPTLALQAEQFTDQSAKSSEALANVAAPVVAKAVKPVKPPMAHTPVVRRDPIRGARRREEISPVNHDHLAVTAFFKPLVSTPTAPQLQQHPWLRPVPIAAVKVEVPISRSGVAANPQLNYIYVKIQQPSDVARLNSITPVMELNVVGDTLMARVGVFTKSRIGLRMLEARIRELKQQKVDMIVANGSTLKELVV